MFYWVGSDAKGEGDVAGVGRLFDVNNYLSASLDVDVSLMARVGAEGWLAGPGWVLAVGCLGSGCSC